MEPRKENSIHFSHAWIVSQLWVQEINVTDEKELEIFQNEIYFLFFFSDKILLLLKACLLRIE